MKPKIKMANRRHCSWRNRTKIDWRFHFHNRKRNLKLHYFTSSHFRNNRRTRVTRLQHKITNRGSKCSRNGPKVIWRWHIPIRNTCAKFRQNSSSTFEDNWRTSNEIQEQTTIIKPKIKMANRRRCSWRNRTKSDWRFHFHNRRRNLKLRYFTSSRFESTDKGY